MCLQPVVRSARIATKRHALRSVELDNFEHTWHFAHTHIAWHVALRLAQKNGKEGMTAFEVHQSSEGRQQCSSDCVQKICNGICHKDAQRRCRCLERCGRHQPYSPAVLMVLLVVTYVYVSHVVRGWMVWLRRCLLYIIVVMVCKEWPNWEVRQRRGKGRKSVYAVAVCNSVGLPGRAARS